VNNILKIIGENTKLISEVVENNPREVKRFINNYIVAYEIYSSNNKQINPIHLLLVQALNVRWNSFYRIIIRFDDNFAMKYLITSTYLLGW
jgi:hypothetical protein